MASSLFILITIHLLASAEQSHDAAPHVVMTRPLHLTQEARYLGRCKLYLENLFLVLQAVLGLTLLDHLLGLGAVSLLHHQGLGALIGAFAGEPGEDGAGKLRYVSLNGLLVSI